MATIVSSDSQALNKLYDEILEAHQNDLKKLHTDFNRRSEEIRLKTYKKLKKINYNDEESKERILQEEKNELNQALSELKQAIHQSSRDTGLKLEEIQAKLEYGAMNLEEEFTKI